MPVGDIIELETVPIDDLTPHPRNYRAHPDDQIEHIATSIREHGLYRNIVTAQDYTILAGHGVVKGAKRVGYTEVPVYRVDVPPNHPKALKILTGDNEIEHLAEQDDRVLTNLLKDIYEFDPDALIGTGYDEQMLANLVMVTRPEDEIEDIDEAAHWVGLPDYEPAGNIIKLVISFRSEDDREAFVELIGSPKITGRQKDTWSIWWPPKEIVDAASVRFTTNGEPEDTPTGTAPQTTPASPIERSADSVPDSRTDGVRYANQLRGLQRTTEGYEPERLIDLADVRKVLWWGDLGEYTNRKAAWVRNRWQELHDLGYSFDENYDLDYWRQQTTDRWQEMDPQTEAEILEFYRTHADYIPEQSLWTYESNLINYCRLYFEWFIASDFECQRFLDFGAGIGDVLLFMGRFTNALYCDVGGVLEDFYRQRCEARQLAPPEPILVGGPDWLLSDVYDETLDVVVTNDTIEHVPEPERVCQGLIDAVRPGGYIATQWTFNDHADDEDAIPTPCHLHTTTTRANATLNVFREQCDEVYATWNSFMRLWRKQ